MPIDRLLYMRRRPIETRNESEEREMLMPLRSMLALSPKMKSFTPLLEV